MNAPDPHSEKSTNQRNSLEERLLAAARTRPLNLHVPAGFAHRVQRQLTMARTGEQLDAWIRGFWQALIPAFGCLAIVLWLQPRNPIGPSHEADADSEAAEISLWEALDANTGEAEL